MAHNIEIIFSASNDAEIQFGNCNGLAGKIWFDQHIPKWIHDAGSAANEHSSRMDGRIIRRPSPRVTLQGRRH